jgi:HAE1 family hydrophobic/amphiphilic exporter-1
MIGRFFYEYGLAIAFAVAVSLLVAFTLTPMLSARVVRREKHTGTVYLVLEQLYDRLERAYRGLLAAALRHRLATVMIALVSTFIGVMLALGVPLEFAPKVDRSEFEGVIELPLGAGIQETKEVARRAGQAVAEVPHVETVFVTVGGGSRKRVNESNLYVILSPKSERRANHLQLMERTREAIRSAAPEAKRIGVNEIAWVSGGGFSSANLTYGIRGPDLDTLETLTNQVLAQMNTSGLYVDASSTYEKGKPEIQIMVDRQRVADLGVPISSLATTVRALVGGVDVATYEESGSRYDVRVRMEEAQRDDVDELGRIQVRAADGRLVDIVNLATTKIAVGPAQIDRHDRSRRVTIHANTVEGVALGTAADRLDEIVAEMGLPAGYASKHYGRAERMRESAEAVEFAFILALAALYIILAIQFNSFIQPAVIMLSAPLAFVGAFAALSFTSTAMSIFAQIGLIALMGLVMKNGILLVDYANQKKAEGLSPREAMSAAAPVRLRPVLMTALSTVFAMTPVALSRSDAAEWRNPMGIILIGGLLSSTFLTLLVVPVIYTLIDELRAAPVRVWTRVTPLLPRLLSADPDVKPPSGKAA